jgi:hypothetical protein
MNTTFVPGQVIGKITGTEADHIPHSWNFPESGFVLQISSGRFIIPSGAFSDAKHSCFPNCGINESLQLVAIRRFNASEIVTIDFSTTLLDGMCFSCDCGCTGCRGIIRAFPLIPYFFQEYYLERRALTHFIKQSLYFSLK